MQVSKTDIGNTPIRSVYSWLFKDKKKKAERVLSKILAVAFPNITRFYFCSSWATSFTAEQTIVEYKGIKLVCTPSYISGKDNEMLFALLTR